MTGLNVYTSPKTHTRTYNRPYFNSPMFTVLQVIMCSRLILDRWRMLEPETRNYLITPHT